PRPSRASGDDEPLHEPAPAGLASEAPVELAVDLERRARLCLIDHARSRHGLDLLDLATSLLTRRQRHSLIPTSRPHHSADQSIALGGTSGGGCPAGRDERILRRTAMRLSRITTVALALCSVLALVAGVDAQQCPKGKLRLYTPWPMHGTLLPAGTGMKNGIDLAVSEVGGVVAGYCLEIVNLDDASPQTGKWDGAVEAENANKAVGDPLAIVYIGTYNSGAAKVSIPITNRAH